MQSTRNKLYLLLTVACMVGYGWLFWAYTFYPLVHHQEFSMCMFKNVTSLPCPSCGATRSVLFLLQGDFVHSFMMNPLGIVLAVIILATPLWIALDVLLKKSTLFYIYCTIENALKKKSIALPALLVVLANWYWNILKGV